MAGKSTVVSYKGYKIEEVNNTVFHVYTAEEWAYGKGLRYFEWEAGSLTEAKEWIDS